MKLSYVLAGVVVVVCLVGVIVILVYWCRKKASKTLELTMVWPAPQASSML